MPFADIMTDLNKIIVQTTWNESDLVKKIPGASWNPKLRLWTLRKTWASCLQLRGTFGDQLQLGDKLIEWSLIEYGTRVKPALRLRELTSSDDGDPLLRSFQRVGVDFLDVADGALLGDEMGTGKTIQVLAWLARLGPDALPGVVISPNSVKHPWRREALRWLPGANPYVIEGGAVQRRRTFEAALQDPLALILINYESLRGHSRLAPYGSQSRVKCLDCGGRDPSVSKTRCEVHARDLNNVPLRTVVLDEAHKIKDPRSKQTRAAWAVGHQPGVEHRVALTGTPIANNAADLWSILHFLAPDEHPTKSLFIDGYCVTAWSKYGGAEVVALNPNRREEFERIFHPRFRRMLKDVVLSQLPPKIRTRRDVELTPVQRRAYTEITTQPAARLEDGSLLVAPTDLELHLRKLQLTGANLRTIGTTPDGKPIYEMCEPSSKIDALLDILDEIGDRPVAVAAEHRQLINLAATRLAKHNIPHGLITGGQLPFERDATLAKFQEGKLRVLLFTVKAGGTGLTMTAADTLVFLERSWSMIDNKQAEDRVHRIGSERHASIQIIDVVARGTEEENQAAALLVKLLRLEEITRDRAARLAARLDTGDLDAEEQVILNMNLGNLA